MKLKQISILTKGLVVVSSFVASASVWAESCTGTFMLSNSEQPLTLTTSECLSGTTLGACDCHPSYLKRDGTTFARVTAFCEPDVDPTEEIINITESQLESGVTAAVFACYSN